MRLLIRARLAWRVLKGDPNVTVLPYALPTPLRAAFTGGTYRGGTATNRGTVTWQRTR
jgi:hypothetical protein